MRPETEARIRSVQKFARNGWQFCALASAMLAIYAVASVAKIFAGPRMAGTRIDLGTFFSVNSDQLATVSSKVWTFVVVAVFVSLFAWTLLHLYRLFKRLEAGSIYTKQNVYHLRQVGLASMALAVIQFLLPLTAFGLAELGFIDRTFVTSVAPGNGVPAFVGPPLSGLITASLILLASWIMDVGTVVSEDAEAMRREAELVI
jgi:hypothetical protein